MKTENSTSSSDGEKTNIIPPTPLQASVNERARQYLAQNDEPERDWIQIVREACPKVGAYQEFLKMCHDLGRPPYFRGGRTLVFMSENGGNNSRARTVGLLSPFLSMMSRIDGVNYGPQFNTVEYARIELRNKFIPATDWTEDLSKEVFSELDPILEVLPPFRLDRAFNDTFRQGTGNYVERFMENLRHQHKEYLKYREGK